MVIDSNESGRRRFLKATLGAGGISSIGSLAGCLGGSEDGGGGGTDGGGEDADGDGSSGEDGTVTETSSSTEVRIASAPLGIWKLPWDQYVLENSVFEENMEEAGYSEYDITWSWEEKVLGASGQADIIPTIGSLEGARLGVEREMGIAVNAASVFTQYQGWVVEAGSPYDPDEAGGQQEAMDKVVEDEAVVGIGSWAGGHIPADQIVIKENWGYDFTEEGDFNVVITDYPTLGRLLAEGDLDVAVTGPPLHAPQLMDSHEFEHSAIYWLPPILEDTGFLSNNFGLTNVLSTEEFANQHSAAIQAYLNAVHQGIEWLTEQDPEDLVKGETQIEALSAQNREEAIFILEWSLNFFEQSILRSDFELTDEYIEADKKAIREAQELGQVPDGWDEYLYYNELDVY